MYGPFYVIERTMCMCRFFRLSVNLRKINILSRFHQSTHFRLIRNHFTLASSMANTPSSNRNGSTVIPAHLTLSENILENKVNKENARERTLNENGKAKRRRRSGEKTTSNRLRPFHLRKIFSCCFCLCSSVVCTEKLIGRSGGRLIIIHLFFRLNREPLI